MNKQQIVEEVLEQLEYEHRITITEEIERIVDAVYDIIEELKDDS